MKIALIFAAFLFSTVHAADLSPTGCTVNRLCLDVPAAGDYISSPPASSRVLMLMNGIIYDSGPYAVAPFSTQWDALPLYAADGSVVYLTATFSTYRTCSRSGRGQTCTTHYTLAAGSIDGPQ